MKMQDLYEGFYAGDPKQLAIAKYLQSIGSEFRVIYHELSDFLPPDSIDGEEEMTAAQINKAKFWLISDLKLDQKLQKLFRTVSSLLEHYRSDFESSTNGWEIKALENLKTLTVELNEWLVKPTAIPHPDLMDETERPLRFEFEEAASHMQRISGFLADFMGAGNVKNQRREDRDYDFEDSRGYNVGPEGPNYSMRSGLEDLAIRPELVGDDWESTPVEALNPSIRLQNALSELGVQNIADLMTSSEQEFLSLRFVGHTTIQELRSKLTKFGLRLPAKDDAGHWEEGKCPVCGRSREDKWLSPGVAKCPYTKFHGPD